MRRTGEELLPLRIGWNLGERVHVRAQLRMHEITVRRRRFRVDDRRERVDFQLDQVDRVLGEIARLGDDNRYRIADEAHFAHRQRLEGRTTCFQHHRRLHRSDAVVEVVAGEHRDDAIERERGARVEFGDRPPRHVATHERRVQHSR